MWKAEKDLVQSGDVEEVNRLKRSLTNYVSKRKKCGSKGLEFNGYKVVIKTLNFSMEYRLNGSEEIL